MEEEEEAPLLTEVDAAEVLQEAQVELEKSLVVPDGYEICLDPPVEALTSCLPSQRVRRARH